MDRDYFLEAGSYDEGMKKWGGENIDLSVRVSDVTVLQEHKVSL